MTPLVPKWAEFGQNQKYQKIRKAELGKVTKFQKATSKGLGVIKNNPWGGAIPPGPDRVNTHTCQRFLTSPPCQY